MKITLNKCRNKGDDFLLILAIIVLFGFGVLVGSGIGSSMERQQFTKNGLGYYQVNLQTGDSTFVYEVNPFKK
jgi:hypothetical protein